MNHAIAVAASILIPSTCFAQAAALPLTFPLVAPLAAVATEGSASTALPFGSSLARHVLYAYDGSTVGFATAARIRAIELRADGAAVGTSTAGNYSFSLICSTGRNAANTLDPVFANNHGADRIQVFNGALALPTVPVGSAPNAFGLRIPFARPFEWDPRNGPLVLEFRYNASTPTFGSFDAVGAPDVVGGLTANGATTTTATSVLATAPVLRLLTEGGVTPAAFTATEASSGTGFPWNRTSGSAMRTLNLYEGPTMPFTGRQLITSLAWRADAGGAFPGRTYDVRISLSTSAATAGTMSTTFAANHGSDLTVVFDGTLVAAPSPASTGLSHFDLFCELQRPFEYDPGDGALAVDLQLRNCSGPTSMNFDVTNLTGLQAGRVSHTANANAVDTTGSGNVSPQPGVALVMAMRSVPVATAPASLANVVNTISNSTAFPFNQTQGRSLNLISAAAAGITQPTFVRHLRFRPGNTTPTGGPLTVTCTVDLSSALTTPATVSPTFDANHGADRVRAFDGQVSVPFFSRVATDPAFLAEIKLDRPFLWDPTTHPYLAVDLVVNGRTGTGFLIETTNGLTVDDARVTNTSSVATTGTTQAIAVTMQIGGEHANGLAVNYGAGCAGTNGVPICTTVGVPCLPERDFALRVHRAAGNSLAVLLVGFSSTNIPLGGAPGCSFLNGLEIGGLDIVITDATGDATRPLPLPGSPVFDGFTFRTQWMVLDPAANALGIAVSDGQVVTARFF